MNLSLYQPQRSVQFKGEAERKAYFDKVSQFSPETLDRLQQVKEAGTGDAHIQLARQFAQIDPDVKFVNTEIRRLAQGRDQATEPSIKAKLQETLNDLRFALGQVLNKFKAAQKPAETKPETDPPESK